MQIRKDMSEQDIFCVGSMLPHYETIDDDRLNQREKWTITALEQSQDFCSPAVRILRLTRQARVHARTPMLANADWRTQSALQVACSTRSRRAKLCIRSFWFTDRLAVAQRCTSCLYIGLNSYFSWNLVWPWARACRLGTAVMLDMIVVQELLTSSQQLSRRGFVGSGFGCRTDLKHQTQTMQSQEPSHGCDSPRNATRMSETFSHG